MDIEKDVNVKNQVWAVIKAINQALQCSNPKKELSKYFHEDMVIVTQGYHEMGKGKDVCIQGYVDFISNARIIKYEIKEPIINIFGDTAIASYCYDTSWEMDGKTYNETGNNVFVLIREQKKWLAVWRTLIPDKSQNK